MPRVPKSHHVESLRASGVISCVFETYLVTILDTASTSPLLKYRTKLPQGVLLDANDYTSFQNACRDSPARALRLLGVSSGGGFILTDRPQASSSHEAAHHGALPWHLCTCSIDS